MDRPRLPKKNFPKINKKIFEKKIPILGICFGLQLIAKNLGGKVKSLRKSREFGNSILRKKGNSTLTQNFFKKTYTNVWMSHQDAVTKMPPNFKLIASTKDSKFTIISNEKKNIYGIQFHPEVTHTENGKKIIKNFVFDICKMKKNWKMSLEVNRLVKSIKEKTEDKSVLCALSGGVDSSVVALLVNKAIKKRLVCIMVDTGLMRKNEFNSTYKIFKKKYNLNIRIIKASKIFFKKLKNISNPEKKRKIIGNLFIKIFEKEAKKKK